MAHVFTYPDDASRFPRSTKEILATAHALGWGMHWAGPRKVMARISAPGDVQKSINVPSTNMNANRVKSILNQIRRYSDDEAFMAYVDEQTSVKPSMRLAMLPDAANATDMERAETAVARAFAEAKPVKDPAVEAVSRVRDTQEPQPAKPDDYVPADVHVVSESPWMVRRGGTEGHDGRMYESPHVQRRVWSDGTTDYRCVHCDYTHENPRSVSAHASRSKSHPTKDETPPLLRVHDYKPTDIKRPMSAIRRLTSDIIHALDGLDDWSSMSPDELARVVAETIYAERPEREPAEPLTPEQIIARITLMVDDGRLAEMHQQVDQAAAALREASDAATDALLRAGRAEAEVERLHEERKVLASLLADDREVPS